MQQNILVISGLSSASPLGLTRSIRMITDMGHLAHPVVTSIDTTKDKITRGAKINRGNNWILPQRLLVICVPTHVIFAIAIPIQQNTVKC